MTDTARPTETGEAGMGGDAEGGVTRDTGGDAEGGVTRDTGIDAEGGVTRDTGIDASSTGAPSADGLPHRDAPATTGELAPLALARRIVDLAEDKKAADIVLLELTPLTTLADYFVICSGGSERQLGAIADGITSSLRDEKTRPIGREGTSASHWVLLDYGSVIVHIFTPPERDYYGLEKHWSEAKTILRVQ